MVLLIAVGGAYAVYRHLNGNLHQLNISGDLGTQPVDTHPQAENIMVIGSDTRHDQGKGFGAGPDHRPVRHADDHAHRGRPEVGQRDVDPA